MPGWLKHLTGLPSRSQSPKIESALAESPCPSPYPLSFSSDSSPPVPLHPPNTPSCPVPTFIYAFTSPFPCPSADTESPTKLESRPSMLENAFTPRCLVSPESLHTCCNCLLWKPSEPLERRVRALFVSISPGGHEVKCVSAEGLDY